MNPTPDSYYGRPVIKAPVWKWPIPAYFFTGGLAAGSSLLAAGARLTGDDKLARRCVLSAAAATAVSTGFLVADLGRPARFLNMFRVARPTSPMSVGSWVLAGFGSAATVAAASEVLGARGAVARIAEGAAAALAPVLGTYTAVLVADTAVPVWHEAWGELPFVFAGGALASAGGLALVLAPVHSPAPARRAALLGAMIELTMSRVMHRRLGELAEPYDSGPPARYRRLATGATVAGVTLIASARKRRVASVAGGLLLLAGAAAERFAVFTAGFESARDPKYTVGPQRQRLAT